MGGFFCAYNSPKSLTVKGLRKNRRAEKVVSR